MNEFEQLQDVLIAINENTNKLSILNERMKTVPVHPNHYASADLKEFERLLAQTKVFTEGIDSVVSAYGAVD
jgi:hypothetical protein